MVSVFPDTHKVQILIAEMSKKEINKIISRIRKFGVLGKLIQEFIFIFGENETPPTFF